ncbi:MAG TPA: hypothetical protein VFX28_03975, partial [Methylomirabilota bacterium]|nr:hypothetical protein [Methylomirabilota bacterium]
MARAGAPAPAPPARARLGLSALAGLVGGDLLAVVWAAQVVAILWPAMPLRGAVTAAFGAYLVAALARARRRTQATAAVIVLAGAALLPAAGGVAALLDGLRFAMLLAAFLPTLLLGRATAEDSPE